MFEHENQEPTNQLPLEDTLDLLAAEADDRELAVAAGELATELRQGASLADATTTLSADLPPAVRGLLEAGVRSGNPAAVVEGYARSRQTAHGVARSMRAAIAYPVLVLMILLPLVAFFSLYVIPIFGDLFESFDLMLPALTEALLRTAEDMPLLLGLFVLAPIGVVVLIQLLGLWPLWHRLRGALPLFGRLWIWSAQQELAATLATLTGLRIPLAESVRYAAGMLSDRNLARACHTVSRQARDGTPLGDAMADSVHFDRLLAALVRWGEQHNELPAALNHASGYFGERIEQHSAMIRRLVPPITTVLVGVVLIMVVIGLFLPLVKLVEGLS